MNEKEAVAKINTWCPFCGSRDTELLSDWQASYVTCNYCFARGPHGDTPEDAIVKWNKCG